MLRGVDWGADSDWGVDCSGELDMVHLWKMPRAGLKHRMFGTEEVNTMNMQLLVTKLGIHSAPAPASSAQPLMNIASHMHTAASQARLHCTQHEALYIGGSVMHPLQH